MTNRRIKVRFAIRLPVTIFPMMGGLPNENTRLFTRDMSAKGAFILTVSPLDLGNDVWMMFHFYENNSLSENVFIKGLVVRT
jgi:hypothetical protein